MNLFTFFYNIFLFFSFEFFWCVVVLKFCFVHKFFFFKGRFILTKKFLFINNFLFLKDNKYMFKKVLFLFSALFVGFINGLFGGGGGMLCVPLLKIFLDLEDKEAHATAVLIMALISIPTLIIYITTLTFNLSNALFLSFGVLGGGIIGSFILNKINNKTLNIIFILITLLAGIRMLF